LQRKRLFAGAHTRLPLRHFCFCRKNSVRWKDDIPARYKNGSVLGEQT
jgi:hypothetical protein